MWMIGETSMAKRLGDKGQPCLIPDVGQIKEERQNPPLMTKAIGLLKRFRRSVTNCGGKEREVKKVDANRWVTEL